MKKIIAILLTMIALLPFAGCEKFLDKSPDMGLDQDDVLKNYKSIEGFLDRAYRLLEYVHLRDQHNNLTAHMGAISDEFSVTYNTSEALAIHSGNWLQNTRNNAFEVGVTGTTSIYYAIQSLRIANIVLANWEKVPGMTHDEANKIRGQAHFLRAWNYFALLKRYGGMPKFDKVFVGDGDENIPRMTYHDSNEWMMEDINAAVEMLPDAWDATNTGRPTKLAAMAFKSMAQLYDASPLMQNGLDKTEVMQYDKDRAKLAAQSAWAAIQYVNSPPGGVTNRLMSQSEYKNIFYWTYPPYDQPEHIWYNRDVKKVTLGSDGNRQRQSIRTFWLYMEIGEGSGRDGAAMCMPTQNMVDMFEKLGPDGNYYPITDPRSGYDPNHPFYDAAYEGMIDPTPGENRDPRFYNNILLPGTLWCYGGQTPYYITLYVGGYNYNYLLNHTNSNGRMQSGYMCKKFMWPEANQFQEGFNDYRTGTIYIRVAQLYLDFAEASYEATGSATTIVEGCGMSAADALNVIRRRGGITDLTTDRYSNFRDAYRRERAVELMFENHRWWDLRRWMTAHQVFAPTYPIKGMRMTPTDPNHANVPDKRTLKFTYEVVDMTTEIRNFQMRNYWYPFTQTDVSSVSNLRQNPEW